ncbi:MAG TPA: cyclic pyranopterin monophosphate synthase MoaC [Bacteroides sp.]|nr:cyclic pyranopterin monophosphate synthase MoaC [Bacteroides sp.]
MVDVGDKNILARKAVASGFIRMSPVAVQAVKENNVRKGDVLSVAQIAGIQAAKQTPSLIPLCHNLLLDKVSVTFEITEAGIRTECSVHCQGKTGVEMEALTGTSVALLTIYDMCKAIDKKMVIEEIRLLKKEKREIDNE